MLEQCHGFDFTARVHEQCTEHEYPTTIDLMITWYQRITSFRFPTPQSEL